MHAAIIRSVQNGKTYHSKLLRRSFRDDQARVQKKTLANLSHLPDSAIDLLRAHLAGQPLNDPCDSFQIVRSRAHGSVLAVLQAFRRLALPRLLAAQPSRQRDLVCAMIAARILRPQTKLSTARWWHGTSLPDYFVTARQALHSAPRGLPGTRRGRGPLLRAPDTRTWAGRRDRTLMLVAVRTGLRASELIGLRCENVQLNVEGAGAHVRCQGKGRKQRCTPLRKDAAEALRAWLAERNGSAEEPVFPNQRGSALSHDGLAYVVDKHVAVAQQACPSLAKKRVTPHVLRHSTAMELLRSGVDRAVIALWLGHESIETTSVYLHADLRLKQEALAKTASTDLPTGRFQPDDDVLAFLNSL